MSVSREDTLDPGSSRRRRRRRVRLPSAAMDEEVSANSYLVSDATTARARESEEVSASADLVSEATAARAGICEEVPANPDLASDAMDAGPRGKSNEEAPANSDLVSDPTTARRRPRARRHRAYRSAQQGQNEMPEPSAAYCGPSAGESDGVPTNTDLADDATNARRHSRARRHRARRSVQQGESEVSEPGTARRSPSTREGKEAPPDLDLPNPSTATRRRRRAPRPSRLGPALATSFAQGTNLLPGEFSALTWEPEAAITYPAHDVALAPLLDIPRSLLDDLETVYRHERARARFERTLRRWVLINLEVEQWEHFVACCMDAILWAIEEKRDFATAHEIMVGWRADDEMMAWKKIRYKSGVRVADLEEKANGWAAATEAARLNICVTWFGVLRESEGPEIDIKPLLLPYIEARKTCLTVEAVKTLLDSMSS